MAKTTPYAKSKGAWTVSSGEYADGSVWTLRSLDGAFADAVDLDGDTTDARVDMPGYGIRPAFWIDTSSSFFD